MKDIDKKNIIFEGTIEDLKKQVAKEAIEMRLKRGITKNFAQYLKDIYFGKKEYDYRSVDLVIEYDNYSLVMNYDTCIYEDEKFWSAMCYLGIRLPIDITWRYDNEKEVDEMKEYVKKHAQKYEAELEITKLFLLGKSPYAKPTKEHADWENTLKPIPYLPPNYLKMPEE